MIDQTQRDEATSGTRGIEGAAGSGDTRRRGKRRAIIAVGALLTAGALVTAAAFTDYALLDLGAGGGFGGADNAYNIQVSTGQENSVGEVGRWVEANPDAEALPIPGADALIPGGDPLIVKVPVRNASKNLDSTLALTLNNVTDGDAPADAAYAALLRFDYGMVDDATTVPADLRPIPAGAFAARGSTATVDLGDLTSGAGRVLVLRVSLANGEDQASTNAANGGGVRVEARLDGTSK